VRRVLERGYGLLVDDGKERLSRDNAAHTVAYEYGPDGRIDSRGGRVGGNLEVDDLVLEPV
jgi:hypothetical protein